ncbi:DNA-binding transcriptional LysR family regulator [Silvimonas terrae]|uniref:DNA-binding transcriptional LysR family regulator n=1 Tax=Silvimonas terrae TaxID=300266 RepID=A0A840RGH2_9NEIS|nr:LysR family transcriptional regulator [Silvimonas terrae]MBB5192137.1 DNA-binding transcriptional LysR family regulator [Silvimonas terrae]
MNVSLRQLRVFLAVAEYRNFSRAGDIIGLTQPAVSRCIRELESEIGIRLLDRTTREVQLTAEGASLVGEVGRLIDELETTLQAARNVGEQRCGRVRVASSPTISANLMPACVADSLQRYPHISLVLHDQVQRANIISVLNGDVDFGVIVEPQQVEELHTESIMEDPFCLILPQTHLLAAKTNVHWQDLDRQKLVLLDYASGSRPLIDQALARQEVTCEVVQELGHPTTVFHMLQTGIGIAVMPRLALPLPADSGLTVRPLTPTVTRHIMLARRRNRSLSPAAQVIWRLIRQMAATLYPPQAGASTS